MSVCGRACALHVRVYLRVTAVVVARRYDRTKGASGRKGGRGGDGGEGGEGGGEKQKAVEKLDAEAEAMLAETAAATAAAESQARTAVFVVLVFCVLRASAVLVRRRVCG